MKRTYSLVALLLTLCCGLCRGGDSVEVVVRPVVSAYALEVGTAHIAQTYLSPLRHRGTAVALSYERRQAMRFDPEHWVMQLDGRLSFASTVNMPARNAKLYDLNLRLGWSMLRRWRAGEWTLWGGGSTSVDLGALYLPRNSNNPVAARGDWTVNLAAGVSRSVVLGRVPVTLRYMAELPLTGIFFSPQYGELYWEIYLGNHSGLIHAAWPGNFFRLGNLLTADVRLGRTIVRLGYRCNIASSKASHIVSRSVEHMAVVGIATEWLSLRPGSQSFDNARIISSLY